MHLMLDLETLGTGPDAAVIEIGAVLFELKGKKRILNHCAFQCFVEPSREARKTMGTIMWWLKQSKAASERFSQNYPQNFLCEELAIKAFLEWPAIETECGGWRRLEGVWSHGAVFDQPILESMFMRNKQNLPWWYPASRDTRTLFDLAGGYPEIDKTGFIQHSAVDDCIMQAMMVQKAFEMLGK